jgi:hypothetical protein
VQVTRQRLVQLLQIVAADIPAAAAVGMQLAATVVDMQLAATVVDMQAAAVINNL